ncbi:GumC family protein [Sphingomonas qomolangmaensis]|uniref:non-specific protein-tyrosine kinase n=1 Tax=Sphingomonas qomolangmaensis TaxID=2918765 RepID=A0ABY5L9J5_9SPHN|nr:polysaccharide biosynthesis tyrosine autokinase [Sphingomonas qomolangmaensis]UUL82394.1 polysaccharide biosynthesis tyrosine autokinase [Sphingomonas qomolangmaensis]
MMNNVRSSDNGGQLNDTGEEPVGMQAASVPLLPDPGLIWQVFRRNLLLFSLVFLAILGLAVAYASLQVPQYVARASVLIEPTSDPVRTTAPGNRLEAMQADEVDTEIRLIASPLVAERAAMLYLERYAPGLATRATATEVAAQAQRILRSTMVTRSGQTRVVDISVRDSDPQMAAMNANLVAEAYLASQVEAKTARSASSTAFINARLSELERNALTTQAALDNYRADRGLAGENGSTNAEQEVSTLNQQLASARADLAEKRGRYSAARAQLSRGGGGADVGAALGSGTIASLRAQEGATSAELAVLRERYGEAHPQRRQTEEELRDIQSRIQEEINRVLSNLQADVQTAQSRVASIEGSRGSALGTVRQNSRAQTGLGELQQKAEAAGQVYQAFLARSQEAGALRDSAMPDAVISTRAATPKLPASPNYPLILIFGLIMATGSGVFAVLLAEYLRRGVQTKRDVERSLRLRYAGAIPSLNSTIEGRKAILPPHEYIISHPHSMFAEAFRSIRAFLTLSPGTRPRAIAITSALPGEGKTTTSVCLARTTAAEGGKVLLVDADFRRRGASSLLEYVSPHDIHDYLDNSAPLAQCIYVDPISGLHVLGSNAVQDSPKSSVNEARVEAMYDELRSNYDIIIVDTAPILAVADGRILATAADRVLLISKWKKTSKRAVEAASAMLIDANAKVTGLALAQVNIKKYASTGDGDVYAYTQKFRGYYQN